MGAHACVQHVQHVVTGTLTNGFLCVPPSALLLPSLCTLSATLQVLGLLVWTLIAGTEYFRVPAFGWVMFVAVFYWVLTVFFLIVYITMTYTRIPQVPWTTVVRIPQGQHLPRAVRWDSKCLLVDSGSLLLAWGRPVLEKPAAAGGPRLPDGLSVKPAHPGMNRFPDKLSPGKLGSVTILSVTCKQVCHGTGVS